MVEHGGGGRKVMISYAGNREDVLLSRLFSGRTEGFYIDIGAGDPEDHSVTKHFYDLGWKGVNVEPSPALFERLNAERDRDVNINMGAGAEPGKLTFYNCPPEYWGYSTFSRQQAEIHRASGIEIQQQEVEITTLTSICEEFAGEEIDFLSIDVEGFEAEVIRGGDFGKWRPRVVLVEATKPSTTIPSHEEWEKILLDSGYVFAYFDGLNRFYLRPEDEELKKHFEIPVNVFDEYQPFEYVRQIRILDQTRKDLNSKLITETALRGACEKTLNSVWADHNQVNERLGQLAAQYQQLLKAIESISGPLRGLEEMGPLGIGLARKMAAGARRFPSAARVIRFGLRSAISLKNKLRRSG